MPYGQQSTPKEKQAPNAKCYINGIDVTSWTNRGQNGTFETVSIRRVYTDKDGKEQTQTVSILADQIMHLKFALDDIERQLKQG